MYYGFYSDELNASLFVSDKGRVHYSDAKGKTKPRLFKLELVKFQQFTPKAPSLVPRFRLQFLNKHDELFGVLGGVASFESTGSNGHMNGVPFAYTEAIPDLDLRDYDIYPPDPTPAITDQPVAVTPTLASYDDRGSFLIFQTDDGCRVVVVGMVTEAGADFFLIPDRVAVTWTPPLPWLVQVYVFGPARSTGPERLNVTRAILTSAGMLVANTNDGRLLTVSRADRNREGDSPPLTNNDSPMVSSLNAAKLTRVDGLELKFNKRGDLIGIESQRTIE